ncbi:DUF5662 family protein [Lewinella sp. W8]|uniref:DUF5662 family protein n=1 Tax=Lewinella sp. W8 TaxID=2528208 RepID=UPI0010677ECB|nr:DUF5662 family protein [Lewinella sp. W8]MTB53059.1 hypothetical protein [Lewinella sp. W8]
MLERIQKFREYLDYVERHYLNVQKAWLEIKLQCNGKGFRFLDDDFVYHSIAAGVKAHDLSKLSAQEFTQYRQWFFPSEGEEKDKAAFDSAWEHHKANNDHHWQTWTKKYENHPYADAFVVEMVVDWMAMGYEFGDTPRQYYENNKDKIDLPQWAIDLMYDIFDCVCPVESN